MLYVGMMLSENGGMESELERRIGKAATSVGALCNIVFGNWELGREVKMALYNAVLLPTMLYGCEAWMLKDRDKDEVEGQG